jgi:uncharacterized protein (TIGR03437 family)
MKQAKWLIFGMLLASGGAWAQSVSSVTISLTVPGPIFIVDGQRYNSPQVFLWPQGSKHSVQFLLSIDETTDAPLGYQAAAGDVARWTFGGWQDNLGDLAPSGNVFQTVTASPTLTSLTGQVTTQYDIALTFYNTPAAPVCGGGAPGDAPQTGFQYGVVYIDGTCYDNSADVWVAAGPHILNAFPYPGFVFVGWLVDGAAPNAYLTTYNLASTTTLIPEFMPAKRVQFRTNPLGLQVVVDHSVITTPPSLPPALLPTGNISPNCTPNYVAIPGAAPLGFTPLCIGDFDFLPGSVHQIAAPSPQLDATGKYWIFGGFSDGLGQNANYVTDSLINKPDLVIANFNPGVQTSILTIPSGLSMQVDGRSNWPSTTFVWGAGETHTVSAPLTNVDSQGRSWQFVSWSNGGAATQTVVVPANVLSFTLSATYQQLGQVTVTSAPPGLSFNVDGSACTTPCVVNHTNGTQMAISIPASVPSTSTQRYDFDSWSSGGSATSMQVTFNQGAQVFTANYHTSFLMAVSANPAAGATFTMSPSSPDGFFAAGTPVTVTAVPKGGFKFAQWTGDYTSTFASAYLTMTVPHALTAVLTSVPYIAPAGIINAAGPTPDGSVAAGSLISIYGTNLSGGLQVGPASPLAQTLGNVTVTANGYLFPLLFVSPSQVNAQVPWELAPGTYTLTVHWTGQPDVSGQFTVGRNAPGVYTQGTDPTQPLALAVHQDATLITAASPARPNEVISIYTNGVGPFTQQASDGYPASATTLWPQADPVSVVIGGTTTLTPYWAGAAPQMIATSIVQLQITNQIPSSTTVDLVISANGKQSASVKLPIQ